MSKFENLVIYDWIHRIDSILNVHLIQKIWNKTQSKLNQKCNKKKRDLILIVEGLIKASKKWLLNKNFSLCPVLSNKEVKKKLKAKKKKRIFLILFCPNDEFFFSIKKIKGIEEFS